MAAEAQPAGQLDGALQDRRSLPSNSQQAIETDAAGDSVGGPGGAADALPALPFGIAGDARFDAPLRSVPGARHDSQQTPERGVPGASVASAGGGFEVSSSVRFDASLRSVPNARHDSQQAPESDALVSAVPAGVYVAAGVPGLARVEGDVGVSGIPSATHLDASLPVRRFLPSNGQQAVEMGVPGAMVPSFGVAVDAPPALSGALQFDASLRSVPNARHDSQQTPESGVPGLGGLAGNAAGAGAAGLAGNTGLAGNPAGAGAAGLAGNGGLAGNAAGAGAAGLAGSAGLAAASGPQATQPIPPSSAGVGVGTSAGVGVGAASVLSPALQFDGSLHDRRFFASNQQVSVESGPLQAPQVTQASQIPPSLQPVPPQLNTIPTQPATPTPLASAPQPALAPQLAAPLFSLASAGHGEHVMTLRVAPDDLGPLTVRAHIDAAGVRIELFAPGDAGRDAVRHVLPELRRSLEDSGASLSLSSQNSPPDAGRDPGQGSGRDPGQGTGQGSGPGSGTRDPDTRTQGPGEQGHGEQGTIERGPNEQGPGEAGHEGADAQPQLPPGVVRRPGSPNRLDILA